MRETTTEKQQEGKDRERQTNPWKLSYNPTLQQGYMHSHRAKQNLQLSPCETAKGKPPLMKGVGWFQEHREWQDSDTLGWGEIVRMSWSHLPTSTELLLSMPAQKPQLVGCYLSLKHWHSTEDRAGSSKVSDQLVSLPCKTHYTLQAQLFWGQAWAPMVWPL